MNARELRLMEARSKTKAPRIFPFKASDSLAPIIRTQYESRSFGSVYVFERVPGKAVKDFRVSWKNECVKAGIPGPTPPRHSLER